MPRTAPERAVRYAARESNRFGACWRLVLSCDHVVFRSILSDTRRTELPAPESATCPDCVRKP